MENSVMFAGHDMKDALMNYLFHQENLRYVNEYTRELVILDEAEREGKEWAKLCGVETYVVTKESLKPLRGESKGSRKKKQKKKKSKNKN
ncbi:hypothetical protein RclHR1_12720008 [Rhizophagus clarus]|uniref:Uncharacterized protein n=1 Tax=Rhizophagus clarus TaxID=94130 RepID=A0A2Z6QNH5_9GLOM|nr:hypothetical protein RclHR1_12720008 [Rhizophagus clarus]